LEEVAGGSKREEKLSELKKWGEVLSSRVPVN
jgi:hypothetical protein